MKTMHLFAGIGGGLLGDLILGHKSIIAVEWDRYACAVLRERAADGWFPDLQVCEGDVRLFDPSEYAGRVDCIHAGFPCQDISNAGKQAGVGEETRSGLYREVLRIADVVRPRYIFLENVSAILNNGLGTVLGDLASRSYDARWMCVRASDVGANHQRDRWWLLAKQRQESKLADSELCGCVHSEPKEQPAEGRIDALCNIGASGEDVAYASRIGLQIECEARIGKQEKVREQGWKEVGGNTGNKNADRGWWKSEPDVCRVVDGVSFRVDKLKGLGNAQVPLQAAVAFKMLEELLCQP